MSRNPNLGLYAVAIAIAVVGALWVGVPAGTLAVLGIALACPVMMLVMMRGMHGDDSRDDDSTEHRGPPR
jgi:hypothetical protein